MGIVAWATAAAPGADRLAVSPGLDLYHQGLLMGDGCKKDDAMLRVQFFNKRGALKKVLFVKRVERIGGRLVATRLKMKDARTGDATLLAVTNIRFRDDLSAGLFSLRELKRR